MKRAMLPLVLVVAPLLTGAIWMDRQPSHQPYQAPVLTPPPGAVPVSGVEYLPEEGDLTNPVPPTPASVAAGRTVFTVNCAMCHGDATKRGPVGLKLTPPPPGLVPPLVQALSDTMIFRAVTKGFGRMPPFQEKLTVQERWSVVNYLRTIR